MLVGQKNFAANESDTGDCAGLSETTVRRDQKEQKQEAEFHSKSNRTSEFTRQRNRTPFDAKHATAAPVQRFVMRPDANVER